MLNDILIQCAEMIGRDDIAIFLQKQKDGGFSDNYDCNCNEKNMICDINRMIDSFNFTTKSLSEEYFELIKIEKFSSDSERKIFYHNFSSAPIKIISVRDENNRIVNFTAKTLHLEVPSAFKIFEVKYKYSLPTIRKLNEHTFLPKNVNSKIICYGVASEFLLSKGEMEKSQYFRKLFIDALFNIKSKRERRIKSDMMI